MKGIFQLTEYDDHLARSPRMQGLDPLVLQESVTWSSVSHLSSLDLCLRVSHQGTAFNACFSEIIYFSYTGEIGVFFAQVPEQY